MKILRRISYYSIGLILGSVVVFLFWKDEKFSFDYLPNARTLKNIRIKKRFFSQRAKHTMKIYKIDTLQISKILQTGDVNFSKSKPHQKPCREYWVNSQNMKKQISLIIKNCDSTATIEKILVK